MAINLSINPLASSGMTIGALANDDGTLPDDVLNHALEFVKQTIPGAANASDDDIKNGIQQFAKAHPDIDPTHLMNALGNASQNGQIGSLLQNAPVLAKNMGVPSIGDATANNAATNNAATNNTSATPPTNNPDQQNYITNAAQNPFNTQNGIGVMNQANALLNRQAPIGQQIGAGLSIQPGAYNNLVNQQNETNLAQGNALVNRFATGQKEQEENQNLYSQQLTEQEKNDPNSTASQLMGQVFQSITGRTPPPGSTYAQMSMVTPVAQDMFNQLANVYGKQQMLGNTQNMLDERQLQSVVNQGSGAVNVAKANRNSILGQNANKFSQGIILQNDLQQIMDQQGQNGGVVFTPQLARAMSTDYANYLNTAGGRQSVQQIDELSNKTLGMNAADAIQYFTNNPTDSRALPFFQNMSKMIAIQQAPLEASVKNSQAAPLLTTFQQLDQIAARNPNQRQAVNAYKKQLAASAGIDINSIVQGDDGTYTYDQTKDTQSLGGHMLGSKEYGIITNGQNTSSNNNQSQGIPVQLNGKTYYYRNGQYFNQ